MKKWVLLVIALAIASPSFGQASMVAQKKRDLNLSSNLSKEQLHLLARAVATEARGQLLVPTGENCNGFSCDKICLAGRVIDYLGDSEGSATPAWSDIGPVGSLTCVAVPGGPIDPPPPPPPASGTATADLQQKQIELLLQIVQKLQTQNEVLVRGLSELKAQIASGIKIRF